MTEKDAASILSYFRVRDNGEITQDTWYSTIKRDTEEAIDMAIKALEQEPCEDCISRQAACDALDRLGYTPGEWVTNGLTMCKDAITALPSATDICVDTTDTISRQAVLDIMQMRMSGKELYKAVYELPPVQPKQKTGHWIIDAEGIITTLYRCSECNRTVIADTDYSPCKDYPFCHCGAKMVESEDKE